MIEWSSSERLSNRAGGAGAELGSESATTKSDRRATPRTTAEKLAYVHLEPDSGAIVLNVSEGGLCFYAVAPLHQTGTIKFWFSMRADQRIEGTGELAWSDKKTGGLRFTSLPRGAVEQIRRWLSESTPAAASMVTQPAPTATAPSGRDPSPHQAGPPASSQALTHRPAAQITGHAVLAGSAGSPGSCVTPVSSVQSPVQSSQIRPREPRGPIHWIAPRQANRVPDRYEGFRMIVAGVVISAAMIAGSVLIYPKQSGADALLTEATANKSANAPKTQTSDDFVMPPAADGRGPTAGRATGDDPKKELKSEIARLEAAYDDETEGGTSAGHARAIVNTNNENANAPRDQMRKQARTAPSTELSATQGLALRPALHPAVSDGVGVPARTEETSSGFGAGSVSNPGGVQPNNPRSAVSSGSSSKVLALNVPAPKVPAPSGLLPGNRPANGQIPGVIFRSPQEWRAETPAVGDLSGDEMYFEVGDFKDLGWAERATDELARFGFASRIMRKRRLWMTSYHVLVGPYSSDNEAEIAREGLESHGYKPRFTR
jgi:hypothetical protein